MSRVYVPCCSKGKEEMLELKGRKNERREQKAKTSSSILKSTKKREEGGKGAEKGARD